MKKIKVIMKPFLPCFILIWALLYIIKVEHGVGMCNGLSIDSDRQFYEPGPNATSCNSKLNAWYSTGKAILDG